MPAHHGAADGSLLRCASCGHSWIEGRAIEVATPVPGRQLAPVIDHGPEPDAEIRRLVEARREAQETFAAQKTARRRRMLTWGSFAAAAVAPLLAVVLLPDAVVRLLPGAAPAYAAAGQEVNIYGLELRRIEMQHLNDNGAIVIAIKGEIANISSSDRKIPWLRFALRDAVAREVYSWTLDSGARPLRAGEITNFVTRVATPPAAAERVEIRFAHADEIGSNTAP